MNIELPISLSKASFLLNDIRDLLEKSVNAAENLSERVGNEAGCPLQAADTYLGEWADNFTVSLQNLYDEIESRISENAQNAKSFMKTMKQRV